MRIFDSLRGSVFRIFEKCTHSRVKKNAIFQENMLKTRVFSWGSHLCRSHLGRQKPRVFRCVWCFFNIFAAWQLFQSFCVIFWPLGPPLVHFGAHLGASWGLLGAFRGLLGASLGLSWAPFIGFWASPGPLFGFSRLFCRFQKPPEGFWSFPSAFVLRFSRILRPLGTSWVVPIVSLKIPSPKALGLQALGLKASKFWRFWVSMGPAGWAKPKWIFIYIIFIYIIYINIERLIYIYIIYIHILYIIYIYNIKYNII